MKLFSTVAGLVAVMLAPLLFAASSESVVQEDEAEERYVTAYLRLVPLEGCRAPSCLDLVGHPEWDGESSDSRSLRTARARGQSREVKRSSPQEPRLTTEILATTFSTRTRRFRSCAS